MFPILSPRVWATVNPRFRSAFTTFGDVAKCCKCLEMVCCSIPKHDGVWAVDVSGNWRVIFKFEDGDAYGVDYKDYH